MYLCLCGSNSDSFESERSALQLSRVTFCVGIALAAAAIGGLLWLGRDLFDRKPPDDTPPPPAAGPPWFRDMTAESGLHFTYRNGEEAKQFSILESLGGGVALIDYDGDGLLDMFVTGGGYFDGADKKQFKGHPCKLFRNRGGWKFEDVTEAAGLARDWHYTHGAAVADFDRDGWPDLLVTGYGRVVLFHNEPDGKGGRHFVDVTAAMGIHDTSWSTSAGWGDIDGDGWPDLYVCHYLDWSFENNPLCKGIIPGVEREVCGPARFKPLKHALYHNQKGRAFRDMSDAHGFRAAGSGLGVVLVDVNGDGRPDIFVGNDGQHKFLFINRGPGRLEEKAFLAGVAVDDNGHPNASMGVDADDYDGSGRASLWVTNFQHEFHGLYGNRGGELFDYHSRHAGIPAIGTNYVGFGTGFVDIDNDGWPDLVAVHGHVTLRPAGGSTLLQPPILLHNVERKGQRYFENVSKQGGEFFGIPARGRGVAIGDLDNDGRADLVVSHTNTPVVLLRNEAAPDAHWIGFRLMGHDHRDVVGSTVIVDLDDRRLTRFAKGGGSYLSASDPRILFGLGDKSAVRRVTVKWSWGETQTWDNLRPDRYWKLIEGQAEAE